MESGFSIIDMVTTLTVWIAKSLLCKDVVERRGKETSVVAFKVLGGGEGGSIMASVETKVLSLQKYSNIK